jgi:hypothetical protein
MVTYVLEEGTASIFRVEIFRVSTLQIEAISLSEIFVAICKTTWLYNPEGNPSG